MAKEPTARALTGFLPVCGGVHIVAYAKALEKLSDVAIGKLLPIPDISEERFSGAKKHNCRGEHTIICRSAPDDSKRCGEIWTGERAANRKPLVVKEVAPEGTVPPDLEAEPQLTAPDRPNTSDLDPDMLEALRSQDLRCRQ